jgi:hypothetical protein
MMARLFFVAFALTLCQLCEAQLIYYKEKIVSPYTVKDDKAERRKPCRQTATKAK